MKKKIILVIAIMLVIALLLVGCSKPSVGTVVNGGFDELTNGTPNSWSVYKDTSGKAEYAVNFRDADPDADESKDLISGKYINFNVSNDYGVYQFRQNVKLNSGKIYKLTYSVNILDDFSNFNYSTKVGIFAGILEGSGNKDFYNSVKTSEWKGREIYLEVENTGTYILAAGVGVDKNGARGAGELDNIKLVEVDSAPAGISTVVIENAGISDGKTEGILYTVFLSIFTLAACVFVYYLLKHYNYRDLIVAPLTDDESEGGKGGKAKKITANDKAYAANAGASVAAVNGKSDIDSIVADCTGKKSKKAKSTTMSQLTAAEKVKKIATSPYAIFSYTMIGMFLIRFLIAYFSAGMSDQLAELGNLSLKIQDVGLSNIYATTTLPIQYGMMYIYAAIGGIADLAGLGGSSLGMFMLLRLPQLVADLIIYYLIFTMLSKNIGSRQGALVACLFAVLPSVFSLSATWGMNASIPLAFIIGAVYAMLNKNVILAIVCATMALIFNVNAVIILPVLFMFIAYYMWKDRSIKSYVTAPVTIMASIVAFFCLALPFTLPFIKDGNFFFVFDKMGTIFASNVKLTNDVFNIFAIFGTGNGVTGVATSVLSSLIMIGLIVGGAMLYMKSKNRVDWIGLTAVSFIAYSIFGVGASFDMMIIGLVVLLIYAVMRNDKRLYKVFTAFSVLSIINIGMVLITSGVLGHNPIFQALFKTDWMYILGSILSVGVAGYWFYVMFDIMSNDFIYEIEPMPSLKDELKSYKTALQNKFSKRKNVS